MVWKSGVVRRHGEVMKSMVMAEICSVGQGAVIKSTKERRGDHYEYGGVIRKCRIQSK